MAVEKFYIVGNLKSRRRLTRSGSEALVRSWQHFRARMYSPQPYLTVSAYNAAEISPHELCEATAI
jgi:hypothetical protein